MMYFVNLLVVMLIKVNVFTVEVNDPHVSCINEWM